MRVYDCDKTNTLIKNDCKIYNLSDLNTGREYLLTHSHKPLYYNALRYFVCLVNPCHAENDIANIC